MYDYRMKIGSKNETKTEHALVDEQITFLLPFQHRSFFSILKTKKKNKRRKKGSIVQIFCPLVKDAFLRENQMNFEGKKTSYVHEQ